MKTKNKLEKGKIFVLFIFLLAANNVYAQPTLPSNADVYWFSSTGSGPSARPIIGFNAAMLSYGTSGGPTDNMFASAYYDQSGSEVIWLNDNASSPLFLTASPNSTLYSVPDIIIGNNTGSTTDFILAIAYIDVNSDVIIDYYDVNYSAGNLNTFNYNTSTTITVGAAHNVHIDAIAHYTDLMTIPGWPLTDAFVVTWDDYSTPANPMVYAQFGSLNAYNISGSATAINPSGSSVYGFAPDVAGIERRVLPGPSTEDVAIVTYVDKTSTKLYSRELGSSTGLTANLTIDGTGASTILRKPRIDAWDNYNYNAIPSAFSKYKIVAQADTVISATTYRVVRTYDHITYPGNFPSSDIIDISGVTGYGAAAPYNCFEPTVAISGPQDYRVFHYMDYGTPGSEIVFLEPVNLGNAFAVLAGTYYWVNSQTSGFGVPGVTDDYGVHATAIAGPANNEWEAAVVYAWAFYNSGTGTYDVAYKFPTPAVYSFKPGSQQTEQGAANWQIFPNPASGTLSVKTTGSSAATYYISDVTGRQLLEGNLTGTKDIDVNSLAAGTYILRIERDGKVDSKQLFVKN